LLFTCALAPRPFARARADARLLVVVVLLLLARAILPPPENGKSPRRGLAGA
jgi:hypothetical protein